MTSSSLRFISPLLVLAVLAVAGCGTQSSAKTSGTHIKSAPTVAPLTPGTATVPATPVVTGGSVAAIVNGHAIPMSLYRSLLILAQRNSAGQTGASLPVLAQQTMNEVIVDEIINQYGAAHSITVSNAELNAQIRKDQAQAHGAQGLQRQLAQVGLTFATYKTLVRTSLLGQKVEQQVAPLGTGPETVAHVRHILITLHPQGKPALTDAAAKAKAQRILSQVQHGGNFAKLARANSDDPGSAAQGGDLGNVYPYQTVPEFDHAAFTLPLHHPALIHTQYGYHIIEVLSRGKAAPKTASDRQAQLQARMNGQQQQFSAWITQQMKRASIKRIAKVQA